MTATATAPHLDQIVPNTSVRIHEGELDSVPKRVLVVGVVLTLVSFIGMGNNDFWYAYTAAYMYGLSCALGALFFVMIQHITRAGWSVVVRRIAENMSATIPAFAVLFIPIAVWGGPKLLYLAWWHPDPADAVLAGKSGYLDPTFFYVRAVIYFAIWIALSSWFRKTSLKQDETGDPQLSLKMARRAAPGLALYGFSLTFAAFDWVMSLNPHWFSTMFGLTYFAGAAMSIFALLALASLWLGKKGYLKEIINAEHYHDMGKLMFAFMVFWAYVNFSQYFLIWYANMPEETGWYADRHGWDNMGTLLVFGHFLAPFAFLLSRNTKRNTTLLTIGCVWMLFIHWVDLIYVVVPNVVHGEHALQAAAEHAGEPAAHATVHAPGYHPDWYHVTTWIGIFCIFAGISLKNMFSAPLIPVRDPRLSESVHFHNI